MVVVSTSSTSLSCATRPEEIEQILSTLSRYDPETSVVLEEYVAKQCQEGTYDIMANLALLKLYLYKSDRENPRVILQVLVKALTAFPSPDFSLCLHLLPPHVLQPVAATEKAKSRKYPDDDDDDEESSVLRIQKLAKLNQLLESGRFAQFWVEHGNNSADDKLAELDEIFREIPDFAESIRRGVVRAIAASFSVIDAAVFQAWTALGPAEAAAYAASLGWTVDGDRVVVGEAKAAADKSKVVVSEQVRFEQLSRMIRRVYE
ncbi:armadillo-type protein [Dipodascopsis tothii]|uniref:armadillo-type protein n=1 Tax=Dipodascopsis tothii TaxID=44089 RepID=UPI0034CF1782